MRPNAIETASVSRHSGGKLVFGASRTDGGTTESRLLIGFLYRWQNIAEWRGGGSGRVGGVGVSDRVMSPDRNEFFQQPEGSCQSHMRANYGANTPAKVNVMREKYHSNASRAAL